MERDKRARTTTRRAFTTVANQLTSSLDAEERNIEEIEVLLELLEERNKELVTLNERMLNAMLDDEDLRTEELDAENAEIDKYKKVYIMLRKRCDKLRSTGRGVFDENSDNLNCSAASNVAKSVIGANENNTYQIKLPPISFHPYDGDLKHWLQFWSQFRKVHDNDNLTDDDKFHYLNQALVPGSPAAQTVGSFPPVGENYEKAIDRLKNRFGREDLLVEVYVRELLKLILNKVLQDGKELNLRQLYDNLDTQLRALETLGVTTDTCAAMLYPLVESCLPEELLRAWQLSQIFDRSSPGMGERLRQLISFLGSEVDNEKRIGLVSEGFGIAVETKIKRNYANKPVKTPTAAVLLAGAAQCIFCERDHLSEACHRAQQMEVETKLKILKNKGVCFKCLRVGHTSRKCKVRLRCVICGRKHVTVMCDQANSDKANKDVAKSANENPRTENALSNLTDTQVLLQTLRVKIINDSSERIARAVIDTGSQRSYILSSTAKEMGYTSRREENLIHALFGGNNTLEEKHDCFLVRLRDLNNTYTCNFEVLGQPVICSEVRSVFDGPWLDELMESGVELSDVGSNSPVEILIGADVAGKLLTGRKIELNSGPVALETQLGWTLMRKVPVTANVRRSTAMTSIALLVQDYDLTQLWNLDVLGIEDPRAKRSKEEVQEEVNEHFLKTVATNAQGRYVVKLPWKSDHLPLSDNYAVAKKRLSNLSKKLKSENVYADYAAVLNEWEEEGVIEVVPEVSRASCHYLPHRAVLKPNSATCKLRPVFDASSHEKGCLSLNDCLEEGPNLIELIPAIILRFRLYRVGVTADIKRAFLQIEVSEDERDWLRFLWTDEDGREKIYRHRRVVFGLCCSPYLLGMTIKHHLSHSQTHEGRSNVLKKLETSFYVDNCITSVHDHSDLNLFKE